MNQNLLLFSLFAVTLSPLCAQTTPTPPPPENPAIKASSEQVSQGNFAAHAVDGKMDTRWCTTGFGANAWLQYDLGREAKIASVQVDWEKNAAYKFQIQTSVDGNTWQTVLDQKANTTPSSRTVAPVRGFARYVKVVIPESTSDLWASIRELRVLGTSGNALESTLK